MHIKDKTYWGKKKNNFKNEKNEVINYKKLFYRRRSHSCGGSGRWNGDNFNGRLYQLRGDGLPIRRHVCLGRRRGGQVALLLVDDGFIVRGLLGATLHWLRTRGDVVQHLGAKECCKGMNARAGTCRRSRCVCQTLKETCETIL